MNKVTEIFWTPADLRIRIIVLLAALCLDFIAGELPNIFHPVAWIGNLIFLLVKLSPRQGNVRQFIVGLLIAVVTPSFCVIVVVAILYALHEWPLVQLLLTIMLMKSMFALKALGSAALVMSEKLRFNNLDGARFELRSLCSRDSSSLSAEQLVAATIESVAENASDSFVAPLFYYVLFGLPGAVFYRAVNTLDSMIGYHGKYEYLGKASARFDDLLNFIPARVTAALILLAGFLSGQNTLLGVQTLVKDGSATESPNAGRPMAAMAGLLQVELEKPGHYKLGQALVPLTIEKISDAWRVTMIAAILGLVFYSFGMGAVYAFAR